MINYVMKFFMAAMLFFSSSVYACGDNPNALVQGPFQDRTFNNGYICFQNTPDKRNIVFYLSHDTNEGRDNDIVDTFYYSDAPVELMSFFFAPVNGKINAVVLLRWNVNYESNGIQYPYYYEIKTYQKKNSSGYELNLNSDKDAQLSGYQTKKNGKVINYFLDDARKIKQYLCEMHGP